MKMDSQATRRLRNQASNALEDCDISEPGLGVRHTVSFLHGLALLSFSLCRPALLAASGLVEDGRFSDMSPEPAALPQGERKCHFLSCKFLKISLIGPGVLGTPLWPHPPSEQSGCALLAARCLSEYSFAQLASHHLGIIPVPVWSHVRLNF